MLTATDRAGAWRVPQNRSGPPMGGAGRHVSAGASPWQALFAEAASGAPAPKAAAPTQVASRGDWPAMGFVPRTSAATQQIGAQQMHQAGSPRSAQPSRPADVPAKGWDPSVDKGDIRPPFVPPKADTVVADASGKIPVDDDEAALAANAKPAETKPEEFSLFGKDGPSLGDIVDIVNPFQHIPLISNIYRDMLGDTISPAARLAGSALFFGPIGAAFAAANVALQGFTGKDAGDHMVAFIKEHQTPDGTAVADATPTETISKAPESKTDSVPEAAMTTAAGATSAPSVVASLVPPGAVPIEGRRVEFKAEALKPIGFAPPSPTPPTAPFQQLIQDLKAGGATLPPADTAAPIAPQTAPQVAPQTTPKNAAAAYAALRADAAAPQAPRPGAVASVPKPAAKTAMPDNVAPGAAANGGGWFTDAMLSALKKYEATDKDKQTKPSAQPNAAGAVDVEN